MKSFGCLIQAALDRGAFLTIGAGCLILHKLQYFPDILHPNILGPLSYGIFSIGAFGVARYILMDSDKGDNSDYEEVLRVLGKQTSEIKANRKEIEELRESCVRFFSMREILEAGYLNPSLLEDRITILQRLQRSPDEETSLHASKGSTQETLSDVREYRGSSAESRVEADVTAGSRDADKKKRETQKEIKLQLPREEILKHIRLDIFRHLGMIVPDDFYEKMNGNMKGDQSEKINAKISVMQRMELYERAMEEVSEMVLIDTAEKELADIFYEVLGELSENILEEISAKIEVEMSERVQAEMAQKEQDVTETELEDILLKVQAQISEAVDVDVYQKWGLKVPENSADNEAEGKRYEELYQQMLRELNESELEENAEKAVEGELKIAEEYQKIPEAECGVSQTLSEERFEKGQENTEKLEENKSQTCEVSNEGPRKTVAEIKEKGIDEALEKTTGIIENISETGNKCDTAEQKRL